MKRDWENIPINNIVCHMLYTAEGDEWGIEWVVMEKQDSFEN